jgi:hypothetical protein
MPRPTAARKFNRNTGVSLANLPAIEGKTSAVPRNRGCPALAMRDNFGRALRTRAAGPVRSQHLIALAGDLDAMVAIAAETALAIERTDPTGFCFDRIECIDAGEFCVKLGPGIVIEQCQRPAACGIPFTLNVAALAADPAQFGLQQPGMSGGAGQSDLAVSGLAGSVAAMLATLFGFAFSASRRAFSPAKRSSSAGFACSAAASFTSSTWVFFSLPFADVTARHFALFFGWAHR